MRTSMVAVALVCALGGTACGGPTTSSPGESAPPSTSPRPSPSTATSPPTTLAVESVCLAGELPFAEGGSLTRLGSGVGDAARVAALRWARHPGCERVVVDLLTAAGSPAGELGDTSVAILDGSGIVRISLPRAVTASGIVDSRFDGDLATRAYVVRLPDGTLAVDVHTAPTDRVVARSFSVDSPTRIVVDLAPAGDDLPPLAAPATVGSDVIVLTPQGGEAAYPLTVSGYARTVEGNVVARLLVDGSVAAEIAATATDWIDAWGTFTLEFDDGPSGRVTLFVGGEAGADPEAGGVELTLLLP